jgi:chorismate mutase
MSTDDPIKDDANEEAPDEEVAELMETHDFDKDTAERVQEIMEDLGVDEDDAVELEELL